MRAKKQKLVAKLPGNLKLKINKLIYGPEESYDKRYDKESKREINCITKCGSFFQVILREVFVYVAKNIDSKH